MAALNLAYVNELIDARIEQHGGERGAPRVEGGVRIGASLNRSCVVMLSAMLQSYIEEVFQEAAMEILPALDDEETCRQYWKQMRDWGNPNSSNIKALFLKIGIPDVLDGITWQRTTTDQIVIKLNTINQLRNDIAHGRERLAVNGRTYSLSLQKVKGLRNFADNFGRRFSPHVNNLIDPA